MPEAVEGVQSRFVDNPEESYGRIASVLLFIPVLPMIMFDYPALGIGTGMQSNARAVFGIPPLPWDIEAEPGRVILELGVVGYVLVWLARLGLMVALVRAALRLRKGGQRGLAGIAFAWAALGVVAPLIVDHIYSALYFIGVGLVLRGVCVLEAETPALVAQVPRKRASAVRRRWSARQP
jgi:hypothetical protein